MSDTADLLSIHVEGTPFLISGATGDGAISTFGVGTHGTASLIDTIGVKQLWLSGMDDLVEVEAAGIDYVAIAATNSSSVSLVRVNASGVMFVGDHITDDQNSRFANVVALDSFGIGNRGFLVAAGSDDGVTLLEMMPDGQFLNIQFGRPCEVQVFAGTQTGDIVQLNLDISNLGFNGGFGHDRLNSGEGSERFFNLGIFDHGSDWIQDYDQAEGDLLVWGGANATANDFQLNMADTPNVGVDEVSEAFVIYRPTGQIIWALVDGAAEDHINLRMNG